MKNFLEYISLNKQKIIVFGHPALSGALLLIACDFEKFYLLSLIALVPFLGFLYKAKNLREIFAGSFVFSLVYWGGFLRSFLVMDIFSWTGVENVYLTALLVSVYWFFFLCLMGVTTVWLFSFLFYKFKTKKYFLDILFFSFLWVVVEYIRTWFVAAVSYSSESLLGPHNTFGSIGYCLAPNLKLLSLAQFGGLYLVGFAAVFINFLVYWFLAKRERSQFYIVVILVTAIFFVLSTFSDKNEGGDNFVRVSVFQMGDDYSIPLSEVKFDRGVDEELLENKEVIDFDPDLIVFPERSSEVVDLRFRGFYYEDKFKNLDKIVIDSGYKINKKGKKNIQLHYYNLENNDNFLYEKMLLSPGGEDFPLIFYFLGRLIGLGNQVDDLVGTKFAKGLNVEIGEFRGKGIGGVLCFEIVSPQIIKEMTKLGAQVFVHPASHLTFRESNELHYRISNVIKMRAVENNRYFIHSGNQTFSSVVTNKGEVISTDFIGNGFLNANVEFIDEETIYIRFGEWLLFLSFSGVGIFIIFKIFLEKF